MYVNYSYVLLGINTSENMKKVQKTVILSNNCCDEISQLFQRFVLKSFFFEFGGGTVLVSS
jgi:hypothetical protein